MLIPAMPRESPACRCQEPVRNGWGKRALASRSADPAGVGGWTSNCSIFAHEKSFSLVSGQSKIHELDQADKLTILCCQFSRSRSQTLELQPLTPAPPVIRGKDVFYLGVSTTEGETSSATGTQCSETSGGFGTAIQVKTLQASYVRGVAGMVSRQPLLQIRISTSVQLMDHLPALSGASPQRITEHIHPPHTRCRSYVRASSHP
jgi:hypothetical protein